MASGILTAITSPPPPPPGTRLSPSLLKRIAVTLPVPKLQPCPGPCPLPCILPRSPRWGQRAPAQGAAIFYHRPHPDLPFLQCPVCAACSIHPAGCTPGGRVTNKQTKHTQKYRGMGEQVGEAQLQPGPLPQPLCTPLHPAPRPRGRPCGHRVPPEAVAFPGGYETGVLNLPLPGEGNPERGRRAYESDDYPELGGCALFTFRAISRLGSAAGASGCDLQLPLSMRGSPRRSSLPKPGPGPAALLALQTHVSEAVPVFDLAAVLRDGRQPLLVFHEIAGGLTLLEPFGVAFGQGGRGEEQQRQR